MRVRTATLLLLMMWALCFAVGAYEIYAVWAEHQGPHGGKAAPPLGLPDVQGAMQPHIKLGA